MKLLNKIAAVLTICCSIAHVQSQNSVNVSGNRSNTLNQNNIQQCDSGYLAFGTTDQLGVQHFSFEKGAKWSMYFKINNQTIYGTMGCMENDSVFLVLGRVGTANTVVIKATTSGRIIWSNWYSTGSDERPDKIVRLKNGDYLISTRTNISYYEFGEWGSRSCVFRIDANGKLLWSRLLDYRSANTYSLVLGMHETENNSILITQIYNNKLGLYKLSPNGDSLKSVLSNQDFTGVSSAFDSKTQQLFVASADNKIIKMDTSFGVSWHKNIAHSNLNSLSYIFLPTDSTMAVGGKYNNDAVVINLDNQANVDKAYYKRFVYSTPSTMMGLFKVKNEVISLISQGFAVSKHNGDLSNTCFNTVNGSQFSTSTLSNLTFVAGIEIKGSATYDEQKEVSLQKSYNVLPSSNCLSADAGARTTGDYSARFCKKFNLKLYVTNYGITNLTSYRIKIEVGGKNYDTLVSSNIGPGSSAFLDIIGLDLLEGENNLRGYVYLPNATADLFNANDTFSLVLHTKTVPKISLTGKDTICSNGFLELKVNGPTGTYSWYHNSKYITQSNSMTNTVQPKGSYFVLYSDSGCVYSSDTFELFHFDSPKIPVITQNGNNLTTDADSAIYWYFNGVLFDSLTNTITNKGTGAYGVRSINDKGCFSESKVFNFTIGSIQSKEYQHFKLLENKRFYWEGTDAMELLCYTFSGQFLKKLVLYPGVEMDANLHAGLYLVKIKNENTIGVIKVLILE